MDTEQKVGHGRDRTDMKKTCKIHGMETERKHNGNGNGAERERKWNERHAMDTEQNGHGMDQKDM